MNLLPQEARGSHTHTLSHLFTLAFFVGSWDYVLFLLLFGCVREWQKKVKFEKYLQFLSGKNTSHVLAVVDDEEHQCDYRW